MTNKNMLDDEGVRQFLEAKGALGPCFACGAADWDISMFEELLTLQIPTFHPLTVMTKDGPRSKPQVLPTVYVECKNCSLVRLHVAASIHRWLAQQKGGGHNE